MNARQRVSTRSCALWDRLISRSSLRGHIRENKTTQNKDTRVPGRCSDARFIFGEQWRPLIGCKDNGIVDMGPLLEREPVWRLPK